MELINILRFAQNRTQQRFVHPVHFKLLKGDARSIRLWENSRTLHVLSGCVWITYKGEDTILRAGEEMQLVPASDHVVISAERCAEASFEIRP